MYNCTPDIPIDLILANFTIIRLDASNLFGGLDALINNNEYRITFMYDLEHDIRIEGFYQRYEKDRFKPDKLERFGSYSIPLKQAIIQFIQSHIKSRDVTSLEIYPE